MEARRPWACQYELRSSPYHWYGKIFAMSTAVTLLKQLNAKNPKARADAISGFMRLLDEPGFSMEADELSVLKERLKDLLGDRALPNTLVAQAILGLPS